MVRIVWQSARCAMLSGVCEMTTQHTIDLSKCIVNWRCPLVSFETLCIYDHTSERHARDFATCQDRRCAEPRALLIRARQEHDDAELAALKAERAERLKVIGEGS